MKIVILDGYCMNPGDLSWDGVKALGDAVIYDRTPEEMVEKRAEGARILLTNKTPVSKDVIEALPKLRYIGLLATGYNVVDVEAARKREIPVTNVPTYGTASVAQMVFAHILNFTQHVAHHGKTVRDGQWVRSLDFCYWDYPLVELEGLTLGIVGFGRIGRAAAGLGLAFGMKVLASDPTVPEDLPPGVVMAEMERIFTKSDFISLHCPLTPETENLVNSRCLSLMKRTAFLINTSRGPLVDEKALAYALNSGIIAGAGLDVLCVEPPLEKNPLLAARNCTITPHIAWANRAARVRLMKVVVDNLKAFLRGKPMNVVN